MRFEEYRRHDAISLAGLIAKREVSAKEVLETAIARVEQVNPAINAIVHKQYEQARKAVAAGLPEGPLKGVPYLIKDLEASSRPVNRRPLAAACSRILLPITRAPT
jgi:amidase